MCYKTHYKHTDKPPIFFFLNETQQYLSARARIHIEMGLMTQNELVRALEWCVWFFNRKWQKQLEGALTQIIIWTNIRFGVCFFLFNWFKCIHWFTHTRCILRSRARKFVLWFILMPNNNFNKFKFITDARTECKQCKNAYKIWWMNWLGRGCVKCIKWMQQQQEDTHEKKNNRRRMIT